MQRSTRKRVTISLKNKVNRKFDCLSIGKSTLFYHKPVGLKVRRLPILADATDLPFDCSVPTLAPRTHIEINCLYCTHSYQTIGKDINMNAVVSFDQHSFGSRDDQSPSGSCPVAKNSRGNSLAPIDQSSVESNRLSPLPLW